MNANPYAAPQTILARFHTHNLPMAEARGNEDERRDFREFSTVQLTEFQEKSRVIEKAQIFWLFAVVVATILVICWFGDSQKKVTDLLTEPLYYPWLAGYLLVLMRFCAGIDRRRWMRPLMVGMDAACVAACGFCLLNPKFHQYFKDGKVDAITKYVFEIKEWYLAIIVFMIGIVYVVSKSGYAAFHAPELFSKHRYGHARLCQELDYRNEYGIE